MACCNFEKAEPVCEMIQTESGNLNIEVMKFDFTSFNSIKNFTKEFSERYR